MKYRYSLFVSLLLLLTTCIDPVSVQLNDPATRLVVDGLITSKPGPYTVKLTTTARYSSGSEGTNLLVKGARVTISDDAGNQEELTEILNGVYTTRPDGIQGQVGRTYTLHIETQEGKQYKSRPELLQETAGVSNIYYEFKEGTAGVQEGFYVYMDIQDPAQTEDYYRWEWIHYESIAYCVLEPPDVFLTCCSRCWDIEKCFGCVNIASDRLNNGGTIGRQLLTVVPYDSRRDYFLYFEQYSLSRDAFKFWNALNEQVNNVGGIFDRPPATIRGNMYNVNDQADVALGYFGASDIKPGYVVVQRDGIAKNPSGPLSPDAPAVSGPPPPCVPCEESVSRTAITPPFWRD